MVIDPSGESGYAIMQAQYPADATSNTGKQGSHAQMNGPYAMRFSVDYSGGGVPTISVPGLYNYHTELTPQEGNGTVFVTAASWLDDWRVRPGHGFDIFKATHLVPSCTCCNDALLREMKPWSSPVF